MRTRRILAITAATLLFGAAGAAAQSCLGYPTRDGQLAIAGSWGISDEIGGVFNADVSGPAAFGVSYHTAMDDGEPSEFAGHGSYDFYMMEPAICVVAGFRFMDRDAAGADPTERLSVPVGFGIGKTLDSDRFAATVFAIPQYMWVREVRPTIEGDETETSNEFAGEAGLTIGLMPVFLTGRIRVSTVEDEVIRLGVGLIF